MFKRLSALAAACALTAIAVPAAAQDASLTANFGERSLSAGFTPDPYDVQIVAGGSIDASRLGGSCVGKISSAPDFQLTYTAGSLPLVFRTRSGEDTTLVINGPNGRWYCDDDSYGDGDAQVRFNSPESGVYDVWIGTYGDSPARGSLLITETP
ncbi:MAG: peptidase S1 [Brevundimonas sp.]|nr:MAG: peptidase S1 [Brevundimonas sp.]